jgi:N-acyl-D-amino-acid deacylase
MITGRRILILIGVILFLGSDVIETEIAAKVPITGVPVSGMKSYDKLIPALMTRWKIPGAAVAVVKDGRLVFAHGYGYADKTSRKVVQPDSLFRVASLSKPITSAAILKLYEEHKLRLEDRPFTMLRIEPPNRTQIDQRLNRITIRQLLYHSGGWDRDRTGYDPMFDSIGIANQLGVPPPVNANQIISYMLSKRLDFNPGTKFSYSNFGYCVLGRVIEKVTGVKYEDYVREALLIPAGATKMRCGRSLLPNRLPGEVRYYDYPGAPMTVSVFPQIKNRVPWPYGGYCIEAMDSHGGWVASTIDLLKFLTVINGRDSRKDILKSTTIKLMVSRPKPPLWSSSEQYYAMGWVVAPMNSSTLWGHAGSLPGTTSVIVRSYDDLEWAILLNSRPRDSASFQAELDVILWSAINQVTTFPEHDLFAKYN